MAVLAIVSLAIPLHDVSDDASDDVKQAAVDELMRGFNPPGADTYFSTSHMTTETFDDSLDT